MSAGRPCLVGALTEAVGSVAAGTMDIEDLHEIECNAMPGAGACGGETHVQGESSASDFSNFFVVFCLWQCELFY